MVGEVEFTKGMQNTRIAECFSLASGKVKGIKKLGCILDGKLNLYMPESDGFKNRNGMNLVVK